MAPTGPRRLRQDGDRVGLWNLTPSQAREAPRPRIQIPGQFSISQRHSTSLDIVRQALGGGARWYVVHAHFNVPSPAGYRALSPELRGLLIHSHCALVFNFGDHGRGRTPTT